MLSVKTQELLLGPNHNLSRANKVESTATQ